MEICRHFLKGRCRFGDQCRYLHEQKNDNPLEAFIQNAASRDNRRPNNKKDRNHRDKLIKRNTESYVKEYLEPDLRVLVEIAKESRTRLYITERDVVVIPEFLCSETDMSLYYQLVDEVNQCGIPHVDLWKLWHGDSHLIADDKVMDKDGDHYKDKCPIFQSVIKRMADYFNVDVKATRFNLYHNDDWKPYHHDAAAIDPHKAKTQNITICLSLGETREVSFQHASGDRRVVNVSLPNGSIYTFSNLINTTWRHGIPPKVCEAPRIGDTNQPKVSRESLGRISIVIWGYSNNLRN